MKRVALIVVYSLAAIAPLKCVFAKGEKFWDSEFEAATKAMEASNYNTAFDLLKSVSNRFPKENDAFLKLANVYNKLHFYDDSALAQQQATQVRLDISSAWCKLGNALWDQGQRQKGIQALQEAVRFNKEDRIAQHDLETASWQQRLTDRAIDQTSLAIKEKPDDAEAWYQLALRFEENGQAEDADAALSRAIQLKEPRQSTAKSTIDR